MSQYISRRMLLGGLATTGISLGFASRPAYTGSLDRTRNQSLLAIQEEPAGPFTLPPLPYDFAALDPHIDPLTMLIHHDNHHGSYVTNLNRAIADQADLQETTLVDLLTNLDRLPEAIRTTVRNNGGGHYNHTMFWEIMAPAGTSAGPSGALAAAITRDFGSLDALKDAVNKAGLGRFGSGWAWVVLKDGKLSVLSTPNQDNPLMDGSGFPVFGVDVWEHAYYLKYQYRRGEYLSNWWNVVNWEAIARRFEQGGGK